MSEMKTFIGTKKILAKAMNRIEAELELGRSVGGDETTAEGYLVRYEDGYESWSPKPVFEAAYVPVDGFYESSAIAQYFRFEHLPVHLQGVSRSICQVAAEMNAIPDSAEKSAGMRKLLEAKDCFVRAAIPAKN